MSFPSTPNVVAGIQLTPEVLAQMQGGDGPFGSAASVGVLPSEAAFVGGLGGVGMIGTVGSTSNGPVGHIGTAAAASAVVAPAVVAP
eukprot:CAMPEP_0182564766 /NCGR_PEP_ID=MMETSP1324-20130603/6646_1 /TAXON_ID=236786 /ORGANISM="Florenciella sp., Strain RCC1587" /LENGTH=86 /DNA_ID=CAMNT_0024778295 /DNA_START=106 /DNA_END=362 /DNA_ORIENTATION=-